MSKYKGAILVMDCWDKHWDEETNIASIHLNTMINAHLNKNRGEYLIIHCPNGCFDYYKSHLQYLHDVNIPSTYQYAPKDYLMKHISKLPYLFIDPSNVLNIAWKTKQNDDISIEKGDYICMNEIVICKLLQALGIKDIYYLGYHLNLCILYTRPMSLLAMKYNGFRVHVLYHLCDTLFDDRYKTDKITNRQEAQCAFIEVIKNIIEYK